MRTRAGRFNAFKRSIGGCSPVHKQFVYSISRSHAFVSKDNATPQTAEQTASNSYAIAHLKRSLLVDIPKAQKPRAKTIGPPYNLPRQW